MHENSILPQKHVLISGPQPASKCTPKMLPTKRRQNTRKLLENKDFNANLNNLNISSKFLICLALFSGNILPLEMYENSFLPQKGVFLSDPQPASKCTPNMLPTKGRQDARRILKNNDLNANRNNQNLIIKSMSNDFLILLAISSCNILPLEMYENSIVPQKRVLISDPQPALKCTPKMLPTKGRRDARRILENYDLNANLNN